MEKEENTLIVSPHLVENGGSDDLARVLRDHLEDDDHVRVHLMLAELVQIVLNIFPLRRNLDIPKESV